MTNPNNAVGTNGAYGGRTSVNALNDVLGFFNGSGILSGWAVSPDTGMTLSIGGVAGTRDVAIAEDNNGNRTTINNISEAPISLTLPAAPSTNSRIDSVVAYVNNPPEGAASVADNPAACGLITVSSTVAANPVAPNDTAIRTAITADGASGSTAYYVVLANITVAANATQISADMITVGSSNLLKDGSITSDKIDFATLLTNPKFIQVGSVQLAYQTTNTSGGFAQISFETSFDNPPRVFLTPYGTADPNGIMAYVAGSITVDGCSVLGRTQGNATVNGWCNFVAIDPNALSISSN